MPKRKPDENVTALPGSQSADEKRIAAENARKAFLASIAGAKLRAEQLPRELLKVVPFAVANKMMVDVLNGVYRPRTAGEAAQVARAALDIGRLEMGDSAAAEPVTAEERKARINEAGLLIEELRKRREILQREEIDAPGPVAADGESAESATG